MKMATLHTSLVRALIVIGGTAAFADWSFAFQ